MLVASFSLDGENVVLHFDADVILLQSRKIGGHNQFSVALEHFDLRRPQIAVQSDAGSEKASPKSEVFHEPAHHGEGIAVRAQAARRLAPGY